MIPNLIVSFQVKELDLQIPLVMLKLTYYCMYFKVFFIILAFFNIKH